MNDNKIIQELENLTKLPEQKHSPLLQIILAILILTAAISLSLYYLHTGPKAKPQPRRTLAPLIEVVTAQFCNIDYRLKAMGTVIAKQSVELKPRVQGQLTSISSQLTPGGFFTAGEIIATIDAEDYRLTLAQLKGEEAKAEAELNLELGRQLVAKKEFQLLGKAVNPKERALMLRTPQLKAAKAALRAIRAKKKIAQADLTNTSIRAPFSAVVINKNVDLGSRVTPTTTIASLVGSTNFLLRLTIPQQQLHWLSIDPAAPSYIQIYQNGNATHSGVLTHISSELEEGSNMAVVYARVDDPLSRTTEKKDTPQLLLGSFVEVEVTGIQLKNVVPITRQALSNVNSVQILDDDGQLTTRKVEILARDSQQVYISTGIREGEHIVISAPPDADRQKQER